MFRSPLRPSSRFNKKCTDEKQKFSIRLCLGIYIYIYISFVRTEIQQPASQESTQNSFHEIRISRRLSLALQVNVWWPEYSSLKYVFAAFVVAQRVYRIPMCINISKEYRTMMK
jgi:hypothetical protein